jgi:glycosyltransferase involved in cell wall biosynthesis
VSQESASHRLLMLGPLNSPHVEHLALAMRERGFDVIAAGDMDATLPASVLTDAGLKVLEAPGVTRRSVTGAVAHVRWIRRLCRELRPDVVHAHWLCGYAAFAALAGAAPLVVMAWGSDVFRANRRQAIANRISVRRAAIAMADSEALCDRLVTLGARPEQVVLVNWGVDLESFAPAENGRAALKERLGLGPGPVILSPRGLTPVYNPEVIVEAFGRLEGELPDAQLVLKHPALDVPDLALSEVERVRVVGPVPYERMAEYYKAADVCVSIPSSDSSPRSVWEAMACGCPVVVSDLPWVHELIEPGRDALVVPIDAGAVADALRRIVGRPELASALGASGRTLVETHRDATAEMDRLAAIYRSLVAR